MSVLDNKRQSGAGTTERSSALVPFFFFEFNLLRLICISYLIANRASPLLPLPFFLWCVRLYVLISVQRFHYNERKRKKKKKKVNKSTSLLLLLL